MKYLKYEFKTTAVARYRIRKSKQNSEYLTRIEIGLSKLINPVFTWLFLGDIGGRVINKTLQWTLSFLGRGWRIN